MVYKMTISWFNLTVFLLFNMKLMMNQQPEKSKWGAFCKTTGLYSSNNVNILKELTRKKGEVFF